VPEQINIEKGIYILEIYLKFPVKIDHEKFSKFKLKKGYYYYVGSAQKKLSSRLFRHLKKEKKIYWHIDYLTVNIAASIKKIYILPEANKNNECNMVALIIANKLGVNSLPGFGNSDCNKCKTHLIYSPVKISQSQLFSLYHSMVLWIPSFN